MAKKYHVRLSHTERAELDALLRGGRRSARVQRHARVLLHADENGPDAAWADARIAAAVRVGVRTVERVRRLCVEQGLERALQGKEPERRYRRTLDGAGEARLVALACGDAPPGRARWTLRLLADRLVELAVVEAISHEAVRRTLKKTNCSPGVKSSG